MKLKNLGFKTQKNIGSQDSYISELLEQSGQLKKFSAGCFGFGTMLVKIKRNVEDLVRRHLDDVGCAEVQYSILQAKSFWQASGRWDKYVKTGTMFTSKGRHSDYAISATAEEFSLAMANGAISSYKDLGFVHYQIGTKFRDEIRCQGGLLKSKEFNMMDAYSFDESKEKMVETYNKMLAVYYKIFEDLGFGDVKNILSVNDMGGKIASEFMWFDEQYGQDTIFCNDKLGLYVNEEVFDIEDEKLREFVLGEHKNIDKSKFEKRKAIELGHIFQNDQVYSKMMNGTFTNRDGKQDYYYNGCYGIGISRIVALLAANSIKKYGKLVWESNVSAFDVNVVAGNDDICLEAAEKVYNQLKARGIKVCLDDRNCSIGAKLKDNELFGICNTIVVGNLFKTSGKYEFENRKTNAKKEITKKDIDKIEFV